MDLVRRSVRSVASLFAVLAAVVLTQTVVLSPPPARADSTVASVAAALRSNPVYVDPAAPSQLSSDQIQGLTQQIESMSSGVRVFVAVLPKTPAFDHSSLLRQLYQSVGVKGVYLATVGSHVDAADYAGVLRTGVAASLATAAGQSNKGNLDGLLTTFVSSVDSTAVVSPAGKSGNGSQRSGSESSSSAVPVLVGLGAVAVVGGGGFALYSSRRRKRIQAQRDADLARVRTAVDEDITAYGERLDELEFSPSDPAATDDMRRDYSKALDQYEAAKSAAAAARRPDDMRAVTEALEEGRFALATLAARQNGRPLPERRAPCFFDPRHGPSVADVTWAPPGGAPRDVPACQADLVRVREGEAPMVRTVQTTYGPQPYYNAGPAYGPWAGGYFGGGMLPALLIGTAMGSFIGGGDTYVENNYYDGGWGDNGPGDSGGGWGDNGGAGSDSGGWGDFGGGDGGGGFGGSDWGGGSDSGGGFGGGDW